MNLTLGKWLDRFLGIPLVYAARMLEVLRPGGRKRVEPRRILMIKLWGAGNVVLIIPIIRALKRRYPDAQLAFLTLESNRSLLAPMKELDEVVILSQESLIRCGASAVGAVRALRRFAPDVLVDFEQFCRLSALLGWMSGAPQRIGLKTQGQARDGLYTAKVPYDDRRHMSRTFLAVARVLGLADEYVSEAPPLSEEDHAEAGDLVNALDALPGDGPRLVFHVGSGKNFRGRRWPVESWAELARRLIDAHGVRILFTGVQDERDLVDACRSAVGRPTADGVGRCGLTGLAALLGRVDALFSNDTAPVHLAGSVGCPVFGFYGPNTPRLYGPRGPSDIVFYKALPCSPCLTNLNAKESSCRLPTCIESITVDEVVEAYRTWASRNLSAEFADREEGAS